MVYTHTHAHAHTRIHTQAVTEGKENAVEVWEKVLSANVEGHVEIDKGRELLLHQRLA